MKKVIALLMTFAMVLGLAACGSPTSSSSIASAGSVSVSSASAADKTVDIAKLDAAAAKTAAAAIDYSKAKVIKFGNSGAVGEPAYNACEYFCNLVNVAFDGRYRFDFYPAEQLGNETTMMENLQTGLQEGMMSALDSLASYSTDLNILSMAFAFSSSEEMINFLNSDKADTLWADLEDNGLHVIAYDFEKNPRGFFCKWELKTPADMVGMKYRIPNLPIFEKNALAMGATPTVISWSEYAYALQTGVVDGGECSKDSYRSAGLYQSAPYFSEVDYAYPVECIYFASNFWNGLSAEDQSIVQSCAAQCQTVYNEQIKATWEKDREWLVKEGGVTFVDFDKEAFMAAAANLGSTLQANGFFKTSDLYDQVVALNEAYRASHT